MINAVLIFNQNGEPRLTKFYSPVETRLQQRLLSETFALVAARPPGSCNFLPLPPLLASQSLLSKADPSLTPSLVTYKQFATLYFILICTSTESPLAIIDLIDVFVRSLDQLYHSVCELDLIFGFETLHACLGEMIVGGIVVEIERPKIVEGVRAQGKVVRRPAGEAKRTVAKPLGSRAQGLDYFWRGR